MSVYNQTYEQSSMHQRPGFKPGFLMLGYCTTVISLPCIKDLVSSQAFNIGIQSNI